MTMTTPRSADWCCPVAAAGKHDFVFRDDVEVYHMVLEGIGCDAGQRALLDELSDGALPGVREGVERVERDERWHIGFGLRCLIEAQPSRSSSTTCWRGPRTPPRPGATPSPPPRASASRACVPGDRRDARPPTLRGRHPRHREAFEFLSVTLIELRAAPACCSRRRITGRFLAVHPRRRTGGSEAARANA